MNFRVLMLVLGLALALPVQADGQTLNVPDTVVVRASVLTLRGLLWRPCERCHSEHRTVFGRIPFAEHIHVVNGQIVSIRGYCDPRPKLGPTNVLA